MNPLTNLRLWWHKPIMNELTHIYLRLGDLTVKLEQLRAIEPALGRIIAKLDPIYGTSDLSAAKRAESDRIGEEAIHRIQAEDKARRHTTGDL